MRVCVCVCMCVEKSESLKMSVRACIRVGGWVCKRESVFVCATERLVCVCKRVCDGKCACMCV